MGKSKQLITSLPAPLRLQFWESFEMRDNDCQKAIETDFKGLQDWNENAQCQE